MASPDAVLPLRGPASGLRAAAGLGPAPKSRELGAPTRSRRPSRAAWRVTGQGAPGRGRGGPGEVGESTHLDAEVLLRHVLGVSRAALLTHPQRRLTPEEVERYRGSGGAPRSRRAGSLPHRRAGVHGLTFAVDRRTLIPRPETETLVERLALLTLLERAPRPLAVDVGTGSGAITVSIAALAPASAALRVVGIDRSWEALQVGRANAARLLPAGRARPLFLQSSLLSGVRGPFDLVLANLPYVRRESWRCYRRRWPAMSPGWPCTGGRRARPLPGPPGGPSRQGGARWGCAAGV